MKGMNSINKLRILILTIAAIGISGCKKFSEVKAPVTSVNESNVYATDATAISVLTGLYMGMSSGTGGGTSFFTASQSISLYGGLLADEFTLYNGISTTDPKYYYYTNSLYSNASGTQGTEFWGIYSAIFTCNAAIEGLSKSSSLTPSVKQQLLGEAKFMRAFFYFYLVNLFGDVPVVLSTDWQGNVANARISKEQVYSTIIQDLKEAKDLLSTDYLDGNLLKYSTTSERVRPTKWAASALLARVYLYKGNLTGSADNYTNAEAEASAVISNTALYDTVSLNNVFLKNSKEAIWQLQPINSQWNTEDARVFILNTSPVGLNSNHPVYLDTLLVNKFDNTDKRKTNWLKTYTDASGTYYYPYKYKSATQNNPLTEYLMVLRLGEQYLIRAEARAQLGNINGAKADLNVIRVRAGLTGTNANDQPSLLAAILQERQLELFSEWGHRWFDLKRTKNTDPVMTMVTPLKGGSWSGFKQLLPIPFKDIQRDPNLIQNPGY
jgi:hypothetical protein